MDAEKMESPVRRALRRASEISLGYIMWAFILNRLTLLKISFGDIMWIVLPGIAMTFFFSFCGIGLLLGIDALSAKIKEKLYQESSWIFFGSSLTSIPTTGYIVWYAVTYDRMPPLSSQLLMLLFLCAMMSPFVVLSGYGWFVWLRKKSS